MLLRFRDDEVSCPCPVEIQELLKEFHHLLKTHCGRKDYWGGITIKLPQWKCYFTVFCVGIESESDGEGEEVAEESVKNLLLSQVANVIGLTIKPFEVAESKAVTTSKCGL